MRFFYWIDRHGGIYDLLSGLLALLTLLVVASQASRIMEADRNVQLAEKLVSFTATLESVTVNSRAMGAIILFGEENLVAKQLATGSLRPNAPRAVDVLSNLRTLFFNDAALLLNRHGVVVAYSSQNNVPNGIGVNLSFRPYAQLAMQGIPSVYPAAGSISPERGIFLAAPIRAGLAKKSKPVGTVAVRVNAGKIDDLLKTWTGGPALLLSPQGVVFASSREDWLFRISGEVDGRRLRQISRARQFGNMFDQAAPRPLPFALPAPEARVGEGRYVVHARPLAWGDPAGDWMLILLDKRDPWWTQWKVLALAGLSALIAALVLFWLRAVARNASLQHETHRELAIAAATFDSREGVVITDARGVILKVNHAFTDITGYSSQEAVGKKPSILSSGRHDAEFYARMWNTVDREKSWSGEIWNKRKSGEIYPQQLTITPIFEDDGKLANYVGIFSDITERKAAELEVQNLAFYDPLTKLPNRRLLEQRLEHATAVGKRGGGRHCALMFMDMDKFKQLNDTHGHGMGDLLLIEVARRIASCVRDADTVARFGGDEFVVMLCDLDADRGKAAVAAGIVAEKIRSILSEPYQLTLEHEGQPAITVEHRCSSSIGVVLFSAPSASPEEILKSADIAMYQAKTDGRNRVRFHGHPA